MLRIGVVMYETSYTKGQELVAERMTREFRAQGHEAFLITSVYGDWEPKISDEQIEKHGGYVHLYDEALDIPVIRVKSSITGWPVRRVAFVDFMSTLTDLVDELKLNVLITHSTLWNGPEDVLRFVEWRRNLTKDGGPQERVAFCHMSHFQEPDSERYEMAEMSYRETWNRVTLAQIATGADLLLVATPLERDQMMALGASEDKCFLFSGGIDDTVSVMSPSIPPRVLGDVGSKKMITTLGTVEERKNILAILEVAKRLALRTDIHFVIAGKVEGEYGKRCAEMAATMSNVTLAGEISDKEKLSLIRQSYLELSMSRADSLGLAQLEFLSEGIPVISSGSGGQAWIVKDGANGLILQGPDDIAGASSAIVRLVDDAPLYKRMGSMAARSARPFTMPRLIYRLSARLEDILSTFSPRSELFRDAPPDEKALETMTVKNQEVIATNRRLIVNAHNSPPVSIPYERITRITRHVEFPWQVLTLGLVISAWFLFGIVFQLQFIEAIPRALQSDLHPLLGNLPSIAVTLGIALLPTLIALIASVATVKRGYLVYQTGSGAIFLPERFLKVLRLINRLTLQELMKD